MDILDNAPELKALVPGGDALPSAPSELPSSLSRLIPPSGSPPPAPSNVLPKDLEGLIPPSAPPVVQGPAASDPNEGLGFWASVGSAAKKGLLEGGLEVQQTQEAAQRAASGQEFFAPSQKVEVHSEVDPLLAQTMDVGFTNPKWWGAQVAYGATKSAPALALGLAGTAAGAATPIPGGALIGGAAGFAAGSGLQSLLPAYQRAKAEGLSDEDAIDRAILTSGLAAGFGAAMGLAPGGVFLGTTAKLTEEGIVQTLKRPISEALVQMGVVQPTIGVAGHIAQEMAQGRKPEDVGPAEIGQAFVLNAATGMMIAGPHLALGARGKLQSPGPEVPLAKPETIQQSFKAQETPPDPLIRVPVEEPITTRILINGDEVVPPKLVGKQEEKPVYFSEVRRVVETHGAESASGGQWQQLLNTERNRGVVKDVELEALNLPSWLQGHDGKISKGDVLAHIESNQLVLEEKVRVDTMGQLARGERTTQYSNQVLPGMFLKYGEVALHLPKGSRAPEESFRSTHQVPDNTLAHFRWTERFDRDGKLVLHVEEIQSDWHQKGRKEDYKGNRPQPFEVAEENGNYFLVNPRTGIRVEAGRSLAGAERLREAAQLQVTTGVPDAPFKTSWQELSFKRILRFAADNGYERITWTNGEQQVTRYAQASESQKQGLRNLYDKEIPKIAEKWARKLGMDGGETALTVPKQEYNLRDVLRNAVDNNLWNGQTRVRFIDVSPMASTRIKSGLPLYDSTLPPQGRFTEKNKAASLDPTREAPGLREVAFQGAKVIQVFQKRFGLSAPLDFEISHDAGRMSRGSLRENTSTGRFEIMVNLAHAKTPEMVWSTLAHEFGHFIARFHYDNAKPSVKFALDSAYRRFRDSIRGGTFGELLDARNNAMKLNDPDINAVEHRNTRLSELSISDIAYYTGQKEWMAEQVAKYMTTSERALGIVDQHFSSLARKIRAVLDYVAQKFGRMVHPEIEVKAWLDSHLDSEVSIGPAGYEQALIDTQKTNQAAFGREGAGETLATPQTASTGGGRGIIAGARLGPNNRGEGMAAAADRMNKFYSWMLGLPQIAKLNPHIAGLQGFREYLSLMHLEGNQMKAEAQETLRHWSALPRNQREALGRFIDDYMNGRFMSEAERAKGLRKPTKAEFEDLAKTHKIGDAAIKVFDRVVKDFRTDLMRYRELLMREARRIEEPLQQLAAFTSIEAQIKAMDEKPYMPAMRFGNFTVTVYSADGKVKHFETFESAKRARLAAKELEGLLVPGEKVLPGMLAKDVQPLMGMPPGLLKMMSEKLNLSDTQRFAMQQLMFEYSPAQSFKHRFQSKELTPGYSDDWMRAYANYKFHGSNHYVRVKYADQLSEMIAQVEAEKHTRTDAIKLGQIRNYMSEVRTQILDPKGDWATLRGLMFHWYLGFNPAAAMTNLSQVPLMTYPFLASKFGGLGVGDVRAAAALARASTQLNTFYRKNTIVASTSADMKGMREAVKEGIISETQAHELAAISEGRNFGFGIGTPGEKAWQQFKEYSAKLFETAEQYNRRVTFRAAWDLAMRHGDSEYVQEMVRQNPLQYQRLRDAGWTHQEASAFTAAKDTVESTQFIYAPYAKPKFMWGKKGTFFVFKSFQQNTLFNLANYPAAAIRSLLILGASAGLMGLPGSEDVNSLIKGIGARLFGKDWDMEQEVRKFVLDMTEERVKPDILMHGASRYGFGLGAIGEMTGVPLPRVDMSRNLSMGNILPFDLGKLITPTKDVAGNEIRQQQRASGAVFGLGFALYNFLTSNPMEEPDRKKWEQIMPRALGNASQALRFAQEGQERNKAGNAVVRFDIHDTQQAAEIIAKGLGYQPTRLTSRWDNIAAKAEAVAYWDIRRELLMRQFWTAYKGGDKEEVARIRSAIQSFNHGLPEDARAKAITTDSLVSSVQNKSRQKALQEAGLPTSPRNMGLYREIDRLYPEGAPTGLVGVQTVK